MKEVAGSLRLDLAAYRELEAFSQLGTELDAASQRQLDRGACMVQLLKQNQYVPFDAIDQTVSIFAGSRGFLDDLKLDQVHPFEKDLHEHMNGPEKALRDELVEKRSFKGGLDDKFAAAIKAFKANWVPSS